MKPSHAVVVIVLALAIASVLPVSVLSLEPVVTIRHPGSLPDVDTEFEADISKDLFVPKLGKRKGTEPDLVSVTLKEPSIPRSVGFQPTQESRYVVLKGELSVSFGQVQLGTENHVHYRDTLSSDGKFQLGPVHRQMFERLYLYYRLKDENVSVYYNDQEKVKPVRIRISLVTLDGVDEESLRYEVSPTNELKRKAFRYFSKFVKKLRENPKYRDREYRLEYMDGANKLKIRRNGTHYIIPTDI